MTKSQRISAVLASFLVFALTQVYVTAFAAPPATAPAPELRVLLPQEDLGVLSIQGTKTVTVNGAPALGGSTIVSGALIQTSESPATVSFGSRGSLEIAADTKLTVTFDKGSIRVNLLQGCVILRTKQGTMGEVTDKNGVIGRSDGTKDGTIDTCPTRTAPAAAAPGIKPGVVALIVAGGAGAIAAIIIAGGDNPSNRTP